MIASQSNTGSRSIVLSTVSKNKFLDTRVPSTLSHSLCTLPRPPFRQNGMESYTISHTEIISPIPGKYIMCTPIDELLEIWKEGKRREKNDHDTNSS